MAATTSQSETQRSPADRLEELLQSSARIEELSSAHSEDEQDEDDEVDSDSSSDDGTHVHGWLPSKLDKNIPALFAHPAILHDDLMTKSSEAHEAVSKSCLGLLLGKEQTILDLNSHGIPHLQRQKHIKFLKQVLGKYPPPFQVMDASRPWLLYWALAGLASLGEDVTHYRRRTIQTFTPLQNPTGGFGGGHGQLSHAAASYAATLSLALVGGLDMIDRRTMWQWLGSVKQKNGGFTMAIGGEEDVRGAYCCMTIHTLLNLPLDLPPDSPARVRGDETFLTNLGEWFGTCQTYEGGMGGAPDNEAHGAYAFCSLACLCLMDAPYVSIPKYLDVPRLMSWMSSRQSAPEGSFAGRTNKLVDACYSHWVGGCWALIEAALAGPDRPPPKSLWSREGLVRYTLCCSQAQKGGLRDKPSTRPDGYHTCYSLAGLSAAQNHYVYGGRGADGTDGSDGVATGLTAAFNWTAHRASEEERKAWAFDEEDTVGFVHPVFVLPLDVVDRTRAQFKDRLGF